MRVCLKFFLTEKQCKKPQIIYAANCCLYFYVFYSLVFIDFNDFLHLMYAKKVSVSKQTLHQLSSLWCVVDRKHNEICRDATGTCKRVYKLVILITAKPDPMTSFKLGTGLV